MAFKTTAVFVLCFMVLTSSLVTASPTKINTCGPCHGENENPAKNTPTLQEDYKMPKMEYLIKVRNSTLITPSADYVSQSEPTLEELLTPNLKKFLKQLKCSSNELPSSPVIDSEISPVVKEMLKFIRCNTASARQISYIFVCVAVSMTMFSL